MKDRYLWLKIAMSYVGAVIGAGFATGQESVQFFLVHREKGLMGAILAGCLFIVFGVALARLATKTKSRSHKQFLATTLGQQVGAAYDFVLTTFLYFGLVIMMAGCGAVFQEHFNLPFTVGVLVSSIVVVVAISGGIQTVFLANMACVPLLLVIGAYVAVSTLATHTHGSMTPLLRGETSASSGSWVWSSILYVSYNLLLALSLFASMGNDIENEQTAATGGLAGGCILCVLIVLFELAIYSARQVVGDTEIPLLVLASAQGSLIKSLYALSLWCAMLTTAVANAYTILSRITSATNTGSLYVSLGIIGTALPLTYVGFVNLVRAIYPFYGYIGVVLIVLVILAILRRRVFMFRI